MNILGIVEFHPLDGSYRGLYLLVQGPAGEFRVPVSQEQAVTLLERAISPEESGEDGGSVDPSYTSFEQTVMRDDEDEEPLVLRDSGLYGMGAGQYDDGDL